MSFWKKLSNSLFGTEMWKKYLEIQKNPNSKSIDDIKDALKQFEKAYGGTQFPLIMNALKSHHPEIQFLYLTLGKKYEERQMKDEALKAYQSAVKYDGYPPQTKKAKEKIKALEE